MTFEWDGMPGHVVVNTMTLQDLGDGRTKLVSTSLFHTTEPAGCRRAKKPAERAITVKHLVIMLDGSNWRAEC
jgi:hypothetical protein